MKRGAISLWFYLWAAVWVTIPIEAKESEALPQWGPVDSMLYSRESPLEPALGGGLWPRDYYPLPNAPKAKEIEWALQVLEERKEQHVQEQKEPVVVVIPERPLKVAPQVLVPQPRVLPKAELVTLSTLQADLRLSRTDSRRLTDRGGELTPERRANFEKFLAFHAEDAAIPLMFAILKSNERLPTGYDSRKLAEKWFGNGLGCLVVYTMGDPRRAEVILSRRAREAEGESREAVLSSQAISDALSVVGPNDQLDRFLAQVSVRLFWLEKTMRPDRAGNELVLAATISAQKSPRAWLQPLVLGLVCVGALTAAAWLFKRRRDRRTVKSWHFYDRDCVERFGGKHCGGSHLVISFEPREAVRARRLTPENAGWKAIVKNE